MNSIVRGSSGIPVNMKAEDFEVYRPEQVSQASTVLMIDLSLSMAMRGNFVAAKKVALALDSLIRTKFPRDSLCIVGFSTYAREVKSEGLSSLNWDEFDPYTNIQHGLVWARKLLSRTPGGTKQIILISDGEPTAHMEGGQLFVQYPPSARTIRETLKEVKRCTHMGILINTFALDRNTYLVDFVDQMTRINRGRVFYTSPDRLGQYILVDYFSNRQRAGCPLRQAQGRLCTHNKLLLRRSDGQGLFSRSGPSTGPTSSRLSTPIPSGSELRVSGQYLVFG